MKRWTKRLIRASFLMLGVGLAGLFLCACFLPLLQIAPMIILLIGVLSAECFALGIFFNTIWERLKFLYRCYRWFRPKAGEKNQQAEQKKIIAELKKINTVSAKFTYEKLAEMPYYKKKIKGIKKGLKKRMKYYRKD